jgi:hypothetical protein
MKYFAFFSAMLFAFATTVFAQDDKPKGADDFWKKVDTKISKEVAKKVDDRTLVRLPTLPIDSNNPKIPAGLDDRLNRNGTFNGTSPSPSPSPSPSSSSGHSHQVFSTFTFVSLLTAFL